MTQYFTEADAGERYALYRPKVHKIALDWLKKAVSGRRFSYAVDVACGTADSTQPLMEIADQVLGIDASEEMLSMARKKGINVARADYSELPSFGRFDLISTCMAFHWFDSETAISSYKAASRQDAIWIIYNFAFGGHSTSNEFNDWFWKRYLKEYPSPPRGKMNNAIPEEDPEIELLVKDSGWMPLEFTLEQLFSYLSTQSNIEHQLRKGRRLKDIRKSILEQISVLNISGPFKYEYSYQIFKYIGS